jgi:hypothetical protein
VTTGEPRCERDRGIGEHQKPSLSKPKSDRADGVLRCCFFVIWEVSAAQPDSAASDELSIGWLIGGYDMGLTLLFPGRPGRCGDDP